jgi:hypothetical protein
MAACQWLRPADMAAHKTSGWPMSLCAAERRPDPSDVDVAVPANSQSLTVNKR